MAKGKYLQDRTPVITLTLLHPLQSIPVQSWSFDSESIIRIGRATDNDVVLYSAVVSRYHVELRLTNSGWEVVSLGANGTYVDGKLITQMPAIDGTVMRLASSGPQVQIKLGSGRSEAKARPDRSVSSSSVAPPSLDEPDTYTEEETG
jgi:pSer/pThr/pTyr-binding forkhead associated (FHA) protein